MSDAHVPDELEAEGTVHPEDLEVPDASETEGLEELPQPDEFVSDAEDSGHTHGLSLDEVAREVSRGEWGTGFERRKSLEEAGYNPNEVEAEVVRLRNAQ